MKTCLLKFLIYWHSLWKRVAFPWFVWLRLTQVLSGLCQGNIDFLQLWLHCVPRACRSPRFNNDNYPFSWGCHSPGTLSLLSIVSHHSIVTAWFLDSPSPFWAHRNAEPGPVPRVSDHSTWKRSIDIEWDAACVQSHALDSVKLRNAYGPGLALSLF